MEKDSLYEDFSDLYDPDQLYEVAHGVHDNHEDEEYARGNESYEQMATRHYA